MTEHLEPGEAPPAMPGTRPPRELAGRVRARTHDERGDAVSRSFGSELRRAQMDAELAASARARELGHDPHGWSRTSYTSATACRACGAQGSIVLRADPPAADVLGRLVVDECRS